MEIGKYCVFLQPTKPVLSGTGRVKDIDGILRSTMPFVGQAEGKGV